jgi:hypothetical protein
MLSETEEKQKNQVMVFPGKILKPDNSGKIART